MRRRAKTVARDAGTVSNARMKPMDRTRVAVRTLRDVRDDHGYVPGTMEERFALVWQLTREACALGGRYDAERRLQRHITRVVRRGR